MVWFYWFDLIGLLSTQWGPTNVVLCCPLQAAQGATNRVASAISSRRPSYITKDNRVQPSYCSRSAPLAVEELVWLMVLPRFCERSRPRLAQGVSVAGLGLPLSPSAKRRRLARGGWHVCRRLDIRKNSKSDGWISLQSNSRILALGLVRPRLGLQRDY